jgi:hypothetical protein
MRDEMNQRLLALLDECGSKRRWSPAYEASIVKPNWSSRWNDGVDDARPASGSMKSGAKMVVVRATV